MELPTLKLHPEEFGKIQIVLDSLLGLGTGISALLIARTGQVMVSRLDGGEFECESLASLAAGNLAATAGLAELIGENAFERIYHRGQVRSILMFPVGGLAFLLLVIPNQARTGELIDRAGLAVLLLQDLLERRNPPAPAVREAE